MSKKYLKKNSRGAALVEYAIVLSCICAVGLSFTGDGLSGTLNGIFNKVNSTINTMLGTNAFSEAVLKDKLIGLKDSAFKSVEHDHGGKHAILGSNFIRDNLFTDTTYENSLINSQKFKDELLSQMDFGDVPLESWRFINEGQGNRDCAYLIWSDTNWGNGDFYDVENSKTACMYARINKATNTVEYGVAYANPLHVHPGNGTLHGGETGKGGMVNLSNGSTSNIKIEHTWVGDNMNAYLASDSPYFTSDYNTAVSYYKALQAKSQTK